jgi:hypothetical protein
MHRRHHDDRRDRRLANGKHQKARRPLVATVQRAAEVEPDPERRTKLS